MVSIIVPHVTEREKLMNITKKNILNFCQKPVTDLQLHIQFVKFSKHKKVLEIALGNLIRKKLITKTIINNEFYYETTSYSAINAEARNGSIDKNSILCA